MEKYRSQKGAPGFDLKTFTEAHFTIPTSKTSGFVSDTSRGVTEHINILWDWLKREADEARPGSSLIPLPFPYIVPGGRFNEIYYWDSYFTMLGLQVSGRVDIIENMVRNFAFLIDEFGFIPNGNRTYFLGRSQPPFFALMVGLLAQEQGDMVFANFFSQLSKEYDFWMKGSQHAETVPHHPLPAERVVHLEGGEVLLNRYYDNFHSPRAEMYSDDLETAAHSDREAAQLYLDLRAACESGWDFSARWLAKPDDLSTIQTTNILPVDLNCLLCYLEETCTKALALQGDTNGASVYYTKERKRKEAIQKYCWSDAHGFFMDYNFVEKRPSDVYSLAGMFPLFFKIATPEQAISCASVIEKRLLRPGGVVSTAVHSGQQWDAPNGWAPLQWITIQGLRNYGFLDLAEEIKNRWVSLNVKVYRNTGKLLEKYNVENMDLLSGGGEYPVQDGFGWTNGVLLKLLSR